MKPAAWGIYNRGDAKGADPWLSIFNNHKAAKAFADAVNCDVYIVRLYTEEQMASAIAETTNSAKIKQCSAPLPDELDAACRKVELLQYRCEELEVVARRYKHVRCLNVPEFKKLFVENLTSGTPFDTLVDNAIAERKL